MPSGTLTVTVPVKLASGVKVAVQRAGLVGSWVRLLRVPLGELMSLAVKPTGVSEKVKVTVVVSPTARLGSAMSTVRVGASVSTATVSLPPVPALPAVSV